MTQELIWLDLETTGLDPTSDVILEIGMVATNQFLDILDEFVQVVHQPKKILESMTEWCINQHGATGLTQDSLDSPIELAVAEQYALDFVEKYAPKQGTAIMCGNTISFDRNFLFRNMRGLHDWFHYRNIDVSGIKTLGAIWYPGVQPMSKVGNHRTVEDLHDSIDELKYYREKIFK